MSSFCCRFMDQSQALSTISMMIDYEGSYKHYIRSIQPPTHLIPLLTGYDFGSKACLTDALPLMACIRISSMMKYFAKLHFIPSFPSQPQSDRRVLKGCVASNHYQAKKSGSQAARSHFILLPLIDLFFLCPCDVYFSISIA